MSIKYFIILFCCISVNINYSSPSSDLERLEESGYFEQKISQDNHTELTHCEKPKNILYKVYQASIALDNSKTEDISIPMLCAGGIFNFSIYIIAPITAYILWKNFR
jgi:hypothetical protein